MIHSLIRYILIFLSIVLLQANASYAPKENTAAQSGALKVYSKGIEVGTVIYDDITGTLKYTVDQLTNPLDDSLQFATSTGVSYTQKELKELNINFNLNNGVNGAGGSLIASIKSRLTKLKNPARALLDGEGIPLINGKQTQVFGGNKFTNVVTANYGDATKKYLWTIDDNGINIGLEQTPIGTNLVIKHTNLSPKAYSGGEIWFITSDKVHINAWSGRFGAGANMTRAEWEASIDAFKNNGYEVIIEPYNP
jgi:hypothetical protein